MLQVADKVTINSDVRKVIYKIELIVNGEALLSYIDNDKKRIGDWNHLSELTLVRLGRHVQQ